MTNTTHPVLQEIIAKAWADEAFKKQLETNPAEVLKQAGLPVPKNQKIEVVSNTEEVMYLHSKHTMMIKSETLQFAAVHAVA